MSLPMGRNYCQSTCYGSEPWPQYKFYARCPMLSFLAAPNQVRWSAIDGTEPMQSHWNELETNSSVVPSLYQELMTGGLFDADIMGWPVMQKKGCVYQKICPRQKT